MIPEEILEKANKINREREEQKSKRYALVNAALRAGICPDCGEPVKEKYHFWGGYEKSTCPKGHEFRNYISGDF